jgi:hypothetical protein
LKWLNLLINSITRSTREEKEIHKRKRKQQGHKARPTNNTNRQERITPQKTKPVTQQASHAGREKQTEGYQPNTNQQKAKHLVN